MHDGRHVEPHHTPHTTWLAPAIRPDNTELAALDAGVALPSALPLLTWVTIAPITSTIRGLVSEVPVGTRSGLDRGSTDSCDEITTVRIGALGDTTGLFFDDQEPDLARAIGDASDLLPA